MTGCPRRRDGVVLRRAGDGSAEVVAGDGAVLGTVNVTAAAAFELCDGATTVEEMAQAASEVFAVEQGEAAAELAQALEALEAMGAVVGHGACSPARPDGGNHTP